MFMLTDAYGEHAFVSAYQTHQALLPNQAIGIPA